MAVCHIHQGKWEQAEADLLDSLQKNNKNPDTLANMLVVAQHRGKPDEILKRYLTQLQQLAPRHAFAAPIRTPQLDSFERNKNRYAI
jgi:coatomer protein complex subunit epsilon